MVTQTTTRITTTRNVTKTTVPLKRPDPVRSFDGYNEYDITSETVRIMGRTLKDGGFTSFNWSNSGFEASFTGTRIEAYFRATNTNSDINRPYIGVFIDGKENIKKIAIDKSDFWCVLADGLTNTKHTVKVIKLTEHNASQIGVSGIRVPVSQYLEHSLTSTNTRKIEFIGDSITCGYGIEATQTSAPFKTSEENSYRTFASITARKLKADMNVIAVSGWGVYKSPYSGNTIPSIYEYTNGITNKTDKWDFNNFKPDVIVMNLGTNDAAYLKSGHMDELGAYTTAYSNFVKTVRLKNPNVAIVICYGMMGSDYADTVQKAIRDTGLNHIYFVELPKMMTVVAGHPSPEDHEDSANALISRIKSIKSWT